MNRFETPYWEKQQVVIGLDEAGRGPMAGPLVVVGVVLPLFYNNPLINDSKTLSANNRLKAFNYILDDALKIIVQRVSIETIDTLNIYQATKQAMESIILRADLPALTDAVPVDVPLANESIIKGDQQSVSIAAASIIAKVLRDRMMITLHNQYPHYGFNQHKGYPTASHKQAVIRYGYSPVHRKTYKFKNTQISLFK